MTVKYKGKILESIKWEKTKENLVNEVEDVELLTKKEKTEENIQKLIKKNNRKEIFKLEKLFKNLLELIKKNNRKEIFKLEKLFKNLLEINENIVNEPKEKEINKILVNEKNKYDGLNEKFLLLNKNLKAKKIENEKFEEYKKLFETEFMDFANEDSTLENEVEVILKIKELEEEIEKNNRKGIFKLEKLFKDLLEINENILNEAKEKEINKILINEKNKYDGLNEKFLLLNKILKAKKIENEKFEEYKKLFETEFMDFANEDSTLENEAEVILKFKELEEEIEKMITFDFLYFKNIISVGGGFSAGKSSFLNGFFDVDKVKLPEGVETVTAIPTYVTQGDENVLGFSSKGGLIKLDSKLYGKLTHAYMKNFEFNIKEIMPYVIIETNIKNGEFDNICFIDTPGYNSGTQIQDRNTSWHEIEYSNSIIWVIESTAGTLKKSDLEFLSDDRLSEKKKYIVLNKADLKPENDIRDIMNEIIDVLDENMIEFEGISAYSSRTKKEFFFEKKSLFEFLKDENKKIKAEEKIVKKIQELFNEYRKSIEYEKDNLKEKRKYIKSLEKEILVNNFDNSEKILDSLFQLRKSFSYTYLDENLLKLSEIETKFIKCIGEIFNINLKVEPIKKK